MQDLWKFFLAAMVCFVIIGGCAPKSADAPRRAFTFDYTPSIEAIPGSAEVTFAVVNTQFATFAQQPTQSITFWTGSKSWGYQQRVMQISSRAPIRLFENFATTMTKDFMEILGAHGFAVRGPFETYDHMIHPDKEGSDLVLTAEIKLDLDDSGIQWLQVKNEKWDPGEPQYFFMPSGLMTIMCDVNLIISESLTNEPMWRKSIVIVPFTVSIPQIPSGSEESIFGEAISSQNLLAFLVKNTNTFHSQVGSALVEQYKDIGNTIYNYLDPREMAIVKNQAMELRKRKVY